MDDDALRRRLRGIDPAASRPLDPITSPRAQELLERTMSSDLSTDLTTPARPDAAPAARRRAPWLVAAAAGVALAGGLAVLSPGEDPAPDPGGTLALQLSGADPLTSVCPVFDPAQLPVYEVAFEGRATQVQGSTATLEVLRWYRGGSAETVTLTGPSSAALTGFDLRAGGTYLVTAVQGTVTDCGYSGPATPELRSAYEAAFNG